MATLDERIIRKVNGEEGFREGVFAEGEGPDLVGYVGDVYESVKKDGVTGETAEAVLGISRHFESGSFDVKPNGHQADWRKIGEMSQYLVQRRPEAHFVIGAREQGFIEAKRATQKALSSGFVVYLVAHLIVAKGSPRLQSWIQALTPGMQRELDRIIGQSAEYFWEQFDQLGWRFIDDWLDRQMGEAGESPADRSVGRFRIIDSGAAEGAKKTNGQAGYNGSTMGERYQGLPEDAVTEVTDRQLGIGACVDPQEVAAALKTVLDAQLSGYEGNPRRRPFRTQEVMRVFSSHGYGAVTVEDLEAEFDYDPNSKLSLRKTITNTISSLNRSFEALGINLKIESARVTVYRFCRRTT
jgi:hypothetical protein